MKQRWLDESKGEGRAISDAQKVAMYDLTERADEHRIIAFPTEEELALRPNEEVLDLDWRPCSMLYRENRRRRGLTEEKPRRC